MPTVVTDDAVPDITIELVVVSFISSETIVVLPNISFKPAFIAEIYPPEDIPVIKPVNFVPKLADSTKLSTTFFTSPPAISAIPLTIPGTSSFLDVIVPTEIEFSLPSKWKFSIVLS